MRIPKTLVIVLCSAAIASSCGGERRPSNGGGDGGATPMCSAAQRYYTPGCAGTGDVVITAGCYQACTGAADTSCPTGLGCRLTEINPCAGTDGGCAACGAEQWLCLAGPRPLASLDEVCEGTLTGRVVLATTSPAYAGTLSYAADEIMTPITIGIALAEGGSILCYPTIVPPPGSAAPVQPAHVELAVTLDVTTEDGAFTESLAATLDGEGPVGSRVTASIAAAALRGTYVADVADVVAPNVSFYAGLTTTTARGDVNQGGMLSTGVGVTEGVGSFMAAATP